MSRSISSRFMTALAAVVLTLAACGNDSPAQGTSATTVAAPSDDAPVSNACPSEGCSVTITDATLQGDEIEVTWATNFVPDISKNHIHIFWDIYTADEVSSDAEARGFVQGEWVPTASFPTYVTEGAVSVKKRGGSTTLCATAGDRDHAVIDPSIVDCIDVSDLL